MNARSAVLTAATVLGLVAVFLGERVLGAGPGRPLLDVLGVLAVAGAAVLRWNRSALSAAAPRARVERIFAVLSTLALLALSDLVRPVRPAPRRRRARPPQERAPAGHRCCRSPPRSWPRCRSSRSSSASWPTRRWPGRPEVEVGRVQDAVGTGVALVSVLTTALALGWVADARDVSADWSYFRPGRPSDSTRGIVRGLTEPVTLTLFYPPGSEVGAAVRGLRPSRWPARARSSRWSGSTRRWTSPAPGRWG